MACDLCAAKSESGKRQEIESEAVRLQKTLGLIVFFWADKDDGGGGGPFLWLLINATLSNTSIITCAKRKDFCSVLPKKRQFRFPKYVLKST